MTTVRLTIDGRPVEVEAGTTVLRAATAAGIHIPTVCDHEALSPYGGCRMCIVQIDGVRGFPTSCTTPATDDMVVHTHTEEVVKLRNAVLELMLSGHPDSCLVCKHREACEKFRPRETKAGKTTRCSSCSNRPSCEIRTISLAEPKRELDLSSIYLMRNLERDDPFMDRDHNLCILCAHCSRVCEKLHGKPAISIVRRGAAARIGTAFDRPYAESGCTFCGACIDICPTGTFADRYAKWQGNPHRETRSACALCTETCTMTVSSRGPRCIATAMTEFERDARLCAVGRFAYPQIMNTPDRLVRPMVRANGQAVPATWEAAIAAAAGTLAPHAGDRELAVIASASGGREARRAWEALAHDVLRGRIGWVPAGGSLEDLYPEDVKRDLLDGELVAAVVAGGWLDRETAEKVPNLVVADFRPSAATEVAQVVLPAAILAEVDATLRSHRGEVHTQPRVAAAPGASRPDWEIARDLAKALGADGAVTKRLAQLEEKMDDPAPTAPAGSPRDDLRALPQRFRGHLLADVVVGLEALGLPASPRPAPAPVTGGFLVVEKREIAPNFFLIELEAPQVASFAKAGQFVIVMVKPTSERTPYTLGDWDAARGTITIVVEEVGRSSRELAMLRKGDRVAHVTGPLGKPYPLPTGATVVVGGGCYGIAAIHPIARALKQADNRVIGVIEGCSSFSLYFEDELRAVCDEVRIATKDGSRGTMGGVGEVFSELAAAGEQVDRFVAIGCTFMMMLSCDVTRPLGIPTDVALNPIMVDGTGMCGACRLTVDGKTKFACVDGPIFDGHKVDWRELSFRRGAYANEEVDALPQLSTLRTPHSHEHHDAPGVCRK